MRQARPRRGVAPRSRGFSLFGQEVIARGGASIDLLDTAVAWFNSTTIVGTNPVTEWQNRGRGGSAFDLDVPVGTPANLITLESGVAWLTGTAGDKFTAPDRAAYRSTGDNSIIFRISAVDWTPGADDIVIACGDVSAAATTNWSVTIDTTGVIIYSRPTGGTARLFTSSAAPTISDGAEIFIKINFDVDDGGGNSAVDFSTSSDGVSYAALGTQQTVANTGAGNSNTTGITIGSGNDNSLPYTGKITAITVYDDLAATSQVAQFNPSQASVNTSTFASGGDTYTLVGDAFVNATNYTGIYSRGSVGLETTAGQTINNPTTVFIVFEPTLAAPLQQRLFDSRSSGTERHSIFTKEVSSDKYALMQSGSIQLNEAYDTNLRVITGQFNSDATSKLTVSDVGSVTGNVGNKTWDFGTFFAALNATEGSTGLCLEFLIFDRALSAADITLVQNHLGAKYA